jgi:methyltransferase-like protein
MTLASACLSSYVSKFMRYWLTAQTSRWWCESLRFASVRVKVVYIISVFVLEIMQSKHSRSAIFDSSSAGRASLVV